MNAPGVARNLTAAPVDEPPYVRTDCCDLITWPLHTYRVTDGRDRPATVCRTGFGCLANIPSRPYYQGTYRVDPPGVTR